jgi:integrase/recombinase XerD
LNVSDLGRDGSITIGTTKNKSPRKAYLTSETKRALADYLHTRKEITGQDPLFATDKGGRFSPVGLYQVLLRRSRDACIDPVGLHAFRRTFALESFRNGAGEINTSRLLGHGNNHGDLNITKRYFALQDDDLRKAHELSSPVKLLKKVKIKK